MADHLISEQDNIMPFVYTMPELWRGSFVVHTQSLICRENFCGYQKSHLKIAIGRLANRLCLICKLLCKFETTVALPPCS